jgi:hypothetical protein
MQPPAVCDLIEQKDGTGEEVECIKMRDAGQDDHCTWKGCKSAALLLYMTAETCSISNDCAGHWYVQQLASHSLAQLNGVT